MLHEVDGKARNRVQILLMWYNSNIPMCGFSAYLLYVFLSLLTFHTLIMHD